MLPAFRGCNEKSIKRRGGRRLANVKQTAPPKDRRAHRQLDERQVAA